MKNGKLIIIASATLVAILVAGGALALKNSTKKEVDAIIYDIDFNSLPENIKAQYIKKSDLDSYGEYITPKSYQEKYSVNEVELDGLNEAQLRQLTINLGSKNRALIADNLDLASKNLDLISKFKIQQKEFDNKINDISKINTDAFKRQQAKFEANENKLKESVKERELEVLQNTKNYDARIATLQNQIDEISNQKDIQISKIKDELANAQNEIKSKQNQIDEANENIAKLQNILSETESENNELKATIEGADNELKQSNSLFARELDRINDGFLAQKKALEDTLSKKSNELIETKEKLQNTEENLKNSNKQISELENEIKNLNKSVQSLKEQSLKLSQSLEQTTSTLNSTKQESQRLEKELNISNTSTKKLKAELEKSAVAYVKLEKENTDLSEALNAKKNENRELNEMIRLKNESLSEQSSAMQKQNSKMVEISAKNDSLNTSIKELKDSLEKSHLAIKQYRQNYEDALKKFDDQVALNEELKNKLTLDANLSQVGKSVSGVFDSFSEYLRSINNPQEFKKESTSNTQAKTSNIPSTEKEIEEMLNKQDALEDENKNLRLMLDAATKMEAPKKLVFVDKVVCEDLGGKNNVSQKCKNKVVEFLGKYNSNYIYEIVPIIDEKNSSFVKSVSKGLKEEEAKKISEYANYGASRARAIIAAQLIKDEYADFARISFSNDIISRDGARGFEIRAYK